MRINRLVAICTGISRRAADQAIKAGRVRINGQVAALSSYVEDSDQVTLDSQRLNLPEHLQTIVFNKPAGYVVSRTGQGSKTIYELLPKELHHLKAVGRLDKDSSGLLLLTNNGKLAQQLTHPSFRKIKIYEVGLDHNLKPSHRQMITDTGIELADGKSKLTLERLRDNQDRAWRVIMHEGRNRQIRRTFDAIGYKVIRLHRVKFGDYILPTGLKSGSYREINQTS